MTHAAPWGNRIVRHGTAKASELLANERNWRIHGRDQQAAMGTVLHDIGFVQNVIVNLRSDESWGQSQGVETLLDGHMRVSLALSRDDETEIPVVYVDLTPREERLVLLTLDPIGAMAGRDREQLVALAEETRLEWSESAIDWDGVLKTERKRARGLAHDVRECLCCKEGCKSGCGCYRNDRDESDEGGD